MKRFVIVMSILMVVGCRQRQDINSLKNAALGQGRAIGELRGHEKINAMLQSRIFVGAESFDASMFLSEKADVRTAQLKPLLGEFSMKNGQFTYGKPDALNSLLWQAIAANLSAELATACLSGKDFIEGRGLTRGESGPFFELSDRAPRVPKTDDEDDAPVGEPKGPAADVKPTHKLAPEFAAPFMKFCQAKERKELETAASQMWVRALLEDDLSFGHGDINDRDHFAQFAAAHVLASTDRKNAVTTALMGIWLHPYFLLNAD